MPPAEHFLYAAAHDLQEPLRKVRTFLGRLESKVKSNPIPGAEIDLEGVRQTLGRMQALLDSLLSLSRIEGRGAVFEVIDMNAALREVLVDLDARIAESRAEISVEGTVPEVAADRTQLHQLLQNLLSNSLKFHKPETPPRIRISIRIESDRPVNGNAVENSYCHIQIQDEGIGFDQSYWPRMLEGFHRHHSRDEFEGTGLGLAICRSIVERHQGELRATSEVDKGTCVEVRLPLHQHARSGDTTVLIGPRTAQHPGRTDVNPQSTGNPGPQF